MPVKTKPKKRITLRFNNGVEVTRRLTFKQLVTCYRGQGVDPKFLARKVWEDPEKMGVAEPSNKPGYKDGGGAVWKHLKRPTPPPPPEPSIEEMEEQVQEWEEEKAEIMSYAEPERVS